MRTNTDLSSQPKVAAKSGVAQSHVGRILRRESAATVDMLDQIAGAFRRPTAELVAPPTYSIGHKVMELSIREPAPLAPHLAELVLIAQGLTTEGQCILVGRAQELATRYSQTQKNPANSSSSRKSPKPGR